MSIRRIKTGFTLVELLVVIGIIALLISMLLPALNRAKEQANLVACQSNLRNIGQMIQEYSAENNGFLPYGYATVRGGAKNLNGQADNVSVTPCWQWADTLTRLVSNQAPGTGNIPLYEPGFGLAANEFNMAPDFSGVFHDYDTTGLPYQNRVSDYFGNPAVLVDTNMPDPRALYPTNVVTDPSAGGNVPGQGYMQIRQMGSIRRPTETMMVWCGPQVTGDGATISQTNGYGALAEQLDGAEIQWTGGSYGSYYPAPAGGGSYNPNFYALPIALGNPNGTFGSTALPVKGVSGVQNPSSATKPVTKFCVTTENVDDTNPMDNYASACAMRFRHMGNTTVNALFIDGHCESRTLLDVTAKDVSITTNTQPGPGPGGGE
jgi:prepilin-type N-terminal cleavage/methylation domain-containing protein/prepilin-type processing-associated H-X9-DG protein